MGYSGSFVSIDVERILFGGMVFCSSFCVRFLRCQLLFVNDLEMARRNPRVLFPSICYSASIARGCEAMEENWAREACDLNIDERKGESFPMCLELGQTSEKSGKGAFCVRVGTDGSEDELLYVRLVETKRDMLLLSSFLFKESRGYYSGVSLPYFDFHKSKGVCFS
ncbi:hypothetical protein M5K25_025069 [Dendrobium thyrsiflorum]|uniref:Uncharacterized protein n=1 Tax=Dendrobium thyrsiflorum TaxID=117978 RepID=A0ABD0U8H2_DENTH